MLAAAGMMGAAAGTAAASSSPPGPTGPPTNASTYNAGDEEDPETGVQWTNADPLAYTGIGFSTSASIDPTGSFDAVPPGLTSYETGDATAGRFWYVRHQRNAQFTVWVLAGAGF